MLCMLAAIGVSEAEKCQNCQHEDEENYHHEDLLPCQPRVRGGQADLARYPWRRQQLSRPFDLTYRLSAPRSFLLPRKTFDLVALTISLDDCDPCAGTSKTR